MKKSILFLLFSAILAQSSSAQSDSARLENLKTLMSGSELGDRVFMMVEQRPEFINGGDAGLMQFLAKTIEYPLSARAAGVMGKVFVSFVVDTDGRTINCKILRNSCTAIPSEKIMTKEQTQKREEEIAVALKDLENESIRVAKLLVFTPGRQRGKNVKVQFTLPIAFMLD